MKQKTLTAVQRVGTKKGAARRLRKMGKIPAVVYGHNEPMNISVDEHEFIFKFNTISESTIIRLNLDDKSHDVLIRDFQENAITGRVLHIDFYEIEKGKQLKTNVCVHLRGASIGVREGGILETFVHELEIECLPRDLPESVVIDISNLQIGHSIHISEIAIPEGVKVLNPGDQVVCTIAHKRVEEEVAEVEIEEEVEEEAEKEAEEAEE